MEILNEITKEVFEQNIPAAKMPERNSSVYERMKLNIQTSYHYLVKNVLGTKEELVDSDETLKKLAIRLVCLDAFIRTCRSLDLVLTATGFGIVSTESTAPASKVRVDALVEEMNVEELRVLALMVEQLAKEEGWGDTPQAKRQITTLFYHPDMLERYTTMPLTYQNWHTARGLAVTADAILRSEISEEYMEELLQKARSASLNDDDLVIGTKCLSFIGDFISKYEKNPMPNKAILRNIMETLETFIENYPTYKSSRLYEKRHAERYENRREDPTFFFV